MTKKLGILYWQNGANKPHKLKKAFKAKKAYQLPFTISCHSLKGISVITPLPTGEGLGGGALLCLLLLLSIMSLWLLHHSVCHYNFCSLCHYVFCIILSVILASVHYVIMASVHYVIMASVPLLLCLLHTLSIMSSVHSVWFRGSFM